MLSSGTKQPTDVLCDGLNGVPVAVAKPRSCFRPLVSRVPVHVPDGRLSVPVVEVLHVCRSLDLTKHVGAAALRAPPMLPAVCMLVGSTAFPLHRRPDAKFLPLDVLATRNIPIITVDGA